MKIGYVSPEALHRIKSWKWDCCDSGQVCENSLLKPCAESWAVRALAQTWGRTDSFGCAACGVAPWLAGKGGKQRHGLQGQRRALGTAGQQPQYRHHVNQNKEAEWGVEGAGVGDGDQDLLKPPWLLQLQSSFSQTRF